VEPPPLARGGRDRRDLRARPKGGYEVGTTKLGKGMKLELAVDRRGRPLAILAAPADEAETRLAEPVVAEVAGELPPGAAVLADRGYDSDDLRDRLRGRGLRLIAAHRKNRTRTRSNDGRRMRRLRRRWVVERTFAWFGRNRRLAKDFEATITSAVTMVHLASIQLLVRRLARA
jgi:transposase